MKNILCFGDSNTYGLRPDNGDRYTSDIRWTGILSKKLASRDYRIIEEGLCGRTTVFEDSTRIGRNGSLYLPVFLESHYPVDTVVLMLGTNDCKTIYNASSTVIGRGIEILLKQIRAFKDDMEIILISPIHLGEKVWQKEYDPEFNQQSVVTSKELKAVFQRLAEEYDCKFLAASDVAEPSETDQEHMDEKSHELLAGAIFEKLVNIEKRGK